MHRALQFKATGENHSLLPGLIFYPPPSFIVIRLVELIAVLALFEEQSLQDLHCRKEHQPTPPSGPD